jgi:polysaccharide export outer membrane protein
MKYQILKIVLVLLAFSTVSCRSRKDLIYLKNAGQQEFLKELSGSVTEYIIKPGDILYVSIKSMNAEVTALFNPEEGMQQSLSSSAFQKYTTPQGAYLYGFEVDNAGNLNLPILGSIPVAGHFQNEIEQIVQERTNHFLKDATVKVKLLNYMVTVLGEVKNPGVYYNYNNDFTVLQAIAMANGNTDYATIKKVMVLRPEPGGKRTYLLDLTSKESIQSQTFYLHPNDYVFVEPDRSKNSQLNSQSYSVFFSSLTIAIVILGFFL